MSEDKVKLAVEYALSQLNRIHGDQYFENQELEQRYKDSLEAVFNSNPDLLRVLTTFLRKCNIRENSISHKACRALDLWFNQKTFP